MRSLGKYQMIEQIGVGGFGEVWKGFDPYIKRHVAVKTCSSDSEDMRTRFFQEAEIAGNLHHKNITTVYDFGVQDGLPYLIQEYLTGEDLDRKVKRRDFLPYPEKLFYLLQIARGLAYAHSKGVIHRDIKPANIRILEDGTAKIMDFGIAKLQQQETGLTQTGMTLGTAAYLAPEQIKGEAVDTATDVFSFGVLAYELLTYHRPFPGEQISAVLYALLHTDPQPVTDHWPAAPRDIVELIDCCLSKQAAGRYGSGGELQRALEAIQKQGAIERTGAVPLPEAAAGSEAVAEPMPTPTPTRLDELEITVMGSGAVPAPEPPSSESPGSGALDLTQQGATSSGATSSRATSSGATSSGATASGDALRHDPRPAGLTGSPRAAKPTEASRAPWIVVALLAVVAGVGGWWLGSRADAPEPASPAVEDVGAGPAEAEASSEPARPSPDAGAEPPPDLSQDLGEGRGEDTAPAPVRARLVIRAPGWTENMTLRLDGGGARALVSNLEFTVDAGRHVLDFAVEEGDYTARSRQAVQVAEGERLVVDPEIRQPAQLSVRPLPRTPQALVRIDGGEPLPTPVNGLFLAPGSRSLEIRARTPDADGSVATLTRSLDLASGQRVALTFDLVTGQINVAER